ncbi:MAG TPA: hypothetical protein VG457_16810 [Planctomycetota bacterium]|jgi:hypothetical protein|nr:hypothetical protein [Planctomycetota bacterium]
MGEVLGSMTPTSAPPDLVSPTILKKAAEVAAARTALLGGMAMAGKGVSIATFGTIAILLFVGGAGGALVLSSTLGEPTSMTMRPRQASEAGDKRAEATPLSTGIEPKTAEILQTSSLPTAPPKAIVARLKNVGGLLREANAAGRKEKDSARASDLYGRLYEEWSAFRPTALANAPVLIAFLRERENEDIVSDLVGLVVNMVRQGLTPSGSGGFLGPGEDPQVPREVIQGLGEMLLSGSKEQKLAVLHWLQDVRGDGNETLADAWLTLLWSEREPKVLVSAVVSAENGLGEVDPNNVAKAQLAKFEQRLDVVRNIWQNFADVKVRAVSLELLGQTKSQAGNELFLEKMQEILQDKNASIADCIGPLACRLPKLALGQEERYLPIVKTALTRITNAEDFEQFLLCCPLSLPPAKAIVILEEARPRSPNASIQTRVDRTLDLLRGGETRSDVLYDALKGTP